MSKAKHQSQREGYHFAQDMKMANDKRKIVEGATYDARNGSRHKVTTVSLCNYGMHAAPTPAGAWHYFKGNTLSKVTVKGIPVYDGYDGSKFCGKTRKHDKVVLLSAEQREFFRTAFLLGQVTAFNDYAKQLVG